MKRDLNFKFFSAKCTVSDYSPHIEVIPGGKSGKGITTRYWDCCKPSCASQYWVKNSKPIASCAVDGKTNILTDDKSGCEDGGDAYMCTNQQPWVVNKTLAYGFAAVSFTGGVDTTLCCICLLLNFEGQLKGKQMLVQYTNTGGPLAVNQFDLALPGGGVGIFPKGCMKQWNAPEHGWGDQYGGVHTEAECSQLPKVLQPGCKFRFEYLEGVSNPNVTFTQVKCPKELLSLTGCNTDKS